jgi:hypothetical protein
MDSIQKIARITAVLIFVTVVLAPFSMVYVPTTLIVAGDATATANNIMASQGLFRVGMASDSIVFLTEIALTVMVYVLLKPVSPTLALIATCARLAMTIVQGINLLNHFYVLLLLSGASYLSAFPPEQLHALVLLFLNAHENVVIIWGLFFALHLALEGYLVFKSDYLPQWLGIVLMFVSLCYFTQNFGLMLLPQYKDTFMLIGGLAVAEIALPLWLLIKGVNVEVWHKRVAALA